MPPSIFCPDTTWTGTQILLSEQHCADAGFCFLPFFLDQLTPLDDPKVIFKIILKPSQHQGKRIVY